MNVVYLEKVYYTIRYRGVAPATRHMPYRVEAQTISEQVQRAADEFGGPLFTYPPFEVTLRGRRAYRWLRPMFDRTDQIHRWQKIAGEPPELICAASPVVPAYLNDMIELLRLRHPGIHIGLPTGSEAQLHELLLTNEADIVIVPEDANVPAKFVACTPLVRIPLVLVVHRDAPWREAKQFFALGTPAHRDINVPLVTSAASESVNEIFGEQLERIGLRWTPGIDAGALQTITALVAGNKNYVGLTLDIPALTDHPQLRRVPLPHFEPLTIVAYQRKPVAPLPRLVVDAVRERARRLLGESRQWLPAAPAAGRPRTVRAISTTDKHG